MQSQAIIEQGNISATSATNRNPFTLALDDIWQALVRWNIFFMLAYQDIKLRYRRSVIGPFWITLSMAITVYSMGYLYGHLFRTDIASYFPFLVAGMLTWTLISTLITDLTEAFVISENLIKQIKLPYSIYIHRAIGRNILIFFHNILVMFPVLIIFHNQAKVNLCSLLVIPNLLLIYINAFCYGFVLAILGTRYRDILQIVKSLVQIVFFMTPIMWNPEILPTNKQFFIHVNPFYSYVELIRAPLIGKAPTLLNYSVTLGLTCLGILLCLQLLIKYRSRIVYWL